MKNKKPKFNKHKHKHGASATRDSVLRTISAMLEITGKNTLLDCLQGLILPFKGDKFAPGTIKASLFKGGMNRAEIERIFQSMKEGETHVT